MTEKKRKISKKMKIMAAEQVVSCPEAYAAVAIRDHLGKIDKDLDEYLDISTLQKKLFDEAGRIINGDDTPIQAVLINQIQTMNTLFYEMTARMVDAKYIDQLKAYGNLALQLQNHTRRTAATLAEIRNPKKTTFVKQANIAHNQQINQVAAPENSENETQPENQVLEAKHVKRLDDRAQETTVGVNPKMETLGKVDRAKVSRR